MPTPLMKEWATKYGLSVQQVEAFWNEAKASARKKGLTSDRKWAYVNGTTHKMCINASRSKK